MDDHRVHAFSMVLRRRERLRTTLRETLAAQQAQHAQALSRLADQEDEVARLAETLAGHEARIGALLEGGAAVRIAELLVWHEHLDAAEKRRGDALAVLDQRQREVAAAERQLAATRAECMRNDARIDLCREKIEALRRQAQARADDAEDEEAEERAVARGRRGSRSRTSIETMGG